jgi:hypothetical protein
LSSQKWKNILWSTLISSPPSPWDEEIPAEAVHYSTLASFSGYYVRVVDTKTLLKELED